MTVYWGRGGGTRGAVVSRMTWLEHKQQPRKCWSKRERKREGDQGKCADLPGQSKKFGDCDGLLVCLIPVVTLAFPIRNHCFAERQQIRWVGASLTGTHNMDLRLEMQRCTAWGHRPLWCLYSLLTLWIQIDVFQGKYPRTTVLACSYYFCCALPVFAVFRWFPLALKAACFFALLFLWCLELQPAIQCGKQKRGPSNVCVAVSN